jgi:hypothetical protein
MQKLKERFSLGKDTSYVDLLEKAGYGIGGESKDRISLSKGELDLVEKLNTYHHAYRKKAPLDQFKENIGYNEDIGKSFLN